MKIKNATDNLVIERIDIALNEDELTNCIGALQTLLEGEGKIKYDHAHIEYEDHSVAITFSLV